MSKLPGIAGAMALGLLSGCGGSEPVANIVVAETGDANVLVPAGNGAPEILTADNAVTPAPLLNLAPDGLTLVTESGSARHANFGQARDIVVPMISAAVGAPTGQGRPVAECGEGPMEYVDFANGLTLYFQRAGFAGWGLDGRDGGPFTTAGGIGIGSTLREMRALGPVEVENTSLGDEFSMGDLSGLLDGTAPESKVTHLWAGYTCIMR